MAIIRTRFVKEEGGFTLSEMMVTITIMMIVFLALYSLFDTGVRIFSYGSNKVEAEESARLGLERMEREIRAAYPVDAGNGNTYLFFYANGLATSDPPKAGPLLPCNPLPPPTGNLSPCQITFGNELGAEGAGDGKITCNPPSTPCEYITYKLTDDVDGSTDACNVSPCDLRRVNTVDSTAAGAPVVDNAVFPGGLDFAYLKSDGITPATTESDIAKVRVSLEILVHPGTQNAARQRLTTEIDLRNRQ